MIAQLDPEYICTNPIKAISRLNSYFFIEGRPVTTRGQWINPFILAQLELIKRLPSFNIVKKPIFILGMGRSGTTILGKVLSIHNQVGFLNEPKALWHVVYPNEDIIGTYSNNSAHYRLDEKFYSERIRHAAHKLYGYCLFITGSERIVDKYPEMIFRIPFLRKIFSDAKFILLVRNGWDTVQSVESWSKRQGRKKRNVSHDWWGVDRRKWKLLIKDIVNSDPNLAELAADISTFTSQKDMAAVEWVAMMQEGIRHIGSIPEQIYMVRFEEFVENPTSVINKLLDFCELPEDIKQIKYANRILSPRRAYGECTLHPAITEIFLKTMENLDYK